MKSINGKDENINVNAILLAVPSDIDPLEKLLDSLENPEYLESSQDLILIEGGRPTQFNLRNASVYSVGDHLNAVHFTTLDQKIIEGYVQNPKSLDNDSNGVVLYIVESKGANKNLMKQVIDLFPKSKVIEPTRTYLEIMAGNVNQFLNFSCTEKDAFEMYKYTRGRLTHDQPMGVKNIPSGVINKHVDYDYSKLYGRKVHMPIALTWNRSGKLEDIPVTLGAVYLRFPGYMGASGVRSIALLEQEQTDFTECEKGYKECEKAGMVFYYWNNPGLLCISVSEKSLKETESFQLGGMVIRSDWIGNKAILPSCDHSFAQIPIKEQGSSTLMKEFSRFKQERNLTDRQKYLMETLAIECYKAGQMVMNLKKG